LPWKVSNLDVPRGEAFGFLGPNGAGKTTAVKLLLGPARPTGDSGTVLGAHLGDRTARTRIGHLPELFRALSVRLSLITGGAIAVVLFGLAWVLGILGRFAAASLEPTSAQLDQAGLAGAIAQGRFGPFSVSGGPGMPELAWSVGWIGIVLIAAVLLFERPGV
jgi:ABC-type Mn2+/Zn2+ transport system ATPase subunit